MKSRMIISMISSGKVRLMLNLLKNVSTYYRVTWLTSAMRYGLLCSLRERPRSIEELSKEMAVVPNQKEALESWLAVGLQLKEITLEDNRYRLSGFLARRLGNSDMDPFAALLEEVAILHHKLIIDTPQKLRRGETWTLGDQDGALIARSSRTLEPIVFEALDAVLNVCNPKRLLEVGAGSGIYIRYALEKNSGLTALGLELQPDVINMARANFEKWSIQDRARIELCDVRNFQSEEKFDIVTLHNNIYYFPVQERVELLRLLKRILTPGGRLLLTTGCRGGGLTMQVLDLWGASTQGCGRLPLSEELLSQLAEAGFTDVTKKNLVPGENYYMFLAMRPG